MSINIFQQPKSNKRSPVIIKPVNSSLTSEYQNHTTESTSSPSPRKKRQANLQLFRSSSTSSIYLENSIINLNVSRMIKGVATILYTQLVEDTKLKKQILPSSDLYFFCEEKYIENNQENFSQENIDNIRKTPTLEDIQKFIESLYYCVNFSPECCIIALIYINRIIALTGLSLQNTTWRPILFVALLISQKVWEDIPLSNSDFLSFYPFFRKEQLNVLEMKFLEMIQYSVFVKLSSFMTFYLNLRDLTYEEYSTNPLSRFKVEEVLFKNKWKGAKPKKKRSRSVGKEFISGNGENYVIN